MNQTGIHEPQGQELDDLTQLFRVLGDPSRVRILFQIFCSEKCVGEVARGLDMSHSAVSHHLHVLKSNRLVRRRREGKQIFYQLDDEHVRTILAQGCSHLAEVSGKAGKTQA